MPGPSNIRKKRKSQGKVQKRKSERPRPSLDSQGNTVERSMSYDSSSPLSRSPSQLLTPPPPFHVITPFKEATLLDNDEHNDNYLTEDLMPQSPFIHDPGNGPRVRDTRAFLTSKFFAQPPALDVSFATTPLRIVPDNIPKIPLCAEFAQEEILQMLCTILPEETALVCVQYTSVSSILTYTDRYFGTTKVVQLAVYVLPVRDYIVWAMFYWTICLMNTNDLKSVLRHS